MIVTETTAYNSLPTEEQRQRHWRFLKGHGDGGRIVMAGRFADAGGALIIWNVGSQDEATRCAQDDPYFKEGVVKFTLREWAVNFNFTVDPPLTPI